MKLRLILCCSLAYFCLFFHGAYADPIRVGVMVQNPPFVSYQNNTYSGLAIDIWKNIAANQNILFTYVPIEGDIDAAIDKLASGQIDVLIGPVAVTYDRFQRVDFTRPFFLNRIGIIEHTEKAHLGQIFFIFLEILSSPFIFGFVLYFIIYIHLLWVFERQTNELVPKKYWDGMSFVFWLHLTQSARWDLPKSIPGRIAVFSWLFTAALLVTSITAAVTSKLTVALTLHTGHFTRPSQLKNASVGVVHDTFAEREAARLGAQVKAGTSIPEIVQWLEEKKVSAVIESHIMAKTFLNTHSYPDLQLAKFSIANDEYAFAIRKGNDPLREKIDRGLLFFQDNDYTKIFCGKYIGNMEAQACML